MLKVLSRLCSKNPPAKLMRQVNLIHIFYDFKNHISPPFILFLSTCLLASKADPLTKRIEEGLSNDNFIEYHDGKAVFVKYKPDTIEVLGSYFEKELKASLMAEQLGLSPPLLWADSKKKSLAFQFLADARPFSGSKQEVQCLAQALNILHSQQPMGETFDPYAQMNQELALFTDQFICDHHQKNILKKWVDDFSKTLVKIENYKSQISLEQRPCHLDLWTPNILYTGNEESLRVWILDWEYAADCDPDYDLAVFSVLDKMSEEQEYNFLRTYGKEIDSTYQNRWTYFKALAALRSASWFATKSIICDKKTMNEEAWNYLELAKQCLSKLS